MITEPIKLLREAEAAAKKGDFKTVKKIRAKFQKDKALVYPFIDEFFESNFKKEDLQ